MTTTDTMNTVATVEQSIRLITAGCELVRITAPSIKEAHNLQNIKNELKKRGYDVPLVADIHFTPNAAEVAARLVEKVRINPGNFADRKKFDTLEYTDFEYEAEIERIRQKFLPLVGICKQYGTAMRIGTNHGSLSDRILSRYGDTPLGMVESAMEFLRIAEGENYHNIVLSMKASNPKVMVEAYRLLVATMKKNGMNYPLHLGVTEAGDGEDGRIKSAVGIGTLLEDGLGDTIRVSLTEDPEMEIPVARKLVDRYTNKTQNNEIDVLKKDSTILKNFYEYKKRKTMHVHDFGADEVPRVFADFSNKTQINIKDLRAIGYTYIEATDKWAIGDQAADYLVLGNNVLDFKLPLQLKAFVEDQNFLTINEENISNEAVFKQINSNLVLIMQAKTQHPMTELRALFLRLEQENIKNPVVIKINYTQNTDQETLQLHAATDVGGLLLDGFGDGIWLAAPAMPADFMNALSFGVLQATRTRISKTEYIACPSCGRTLFDLQETTQKIRSVTSHLKGLKIGIMGCIVNGPGEMADADFGYVGSGIDKITLYKGQEMIKKNVPADRAVDELVGLIKAYGMWIEPKNLDISA